MASDAFKKFGISKQELEEMIRASAEVDSEMNDFMANEIVPYWKSVSPRDSSTYAASVKVTKKAKGGKGKVGATAWYAHFVEFGTGADSKGPETRKVKTSQGWKTLPKDTPTRAFAPGEKTAQHFGGNLDKGGISFDGGDDEQ